MVMYTGVHNLQHSHVRMCAQLPGYMQVSGAVCARVCMCVCMHAGSAYRACFGVMRQMSGASCEALLWFSSTAAGRDAVTLFLPASTSPFAQLH
eukprot:1156354-Pelagomonas_calceolata.AAC.5